MKHITLSLLMTVLFAGYSVAQVTLDSVSTMLGNTNSVFYKLTDGSKTSVSNSGWGLAFDVSQFGASIRSNGQAGVEVYAYPNGDTTTWASADTTGISGWDKLYNSDAHWFAGALEMAAGTDPFDVGWGCLLYTSPSPRDLSTSRMPSSA